MHLGSSVICPVTGIPMIVAAGAMIFYSVKKAKAEFKKENILSAIALSAFVFALQMINFSFSPINFSVHIIGTVLLTAVLGHWVSFLAMSMILAFQAFLFADGGLLALGCNIFNMGIIPCFIIYPLIFKPLKNKNKLTLAIFLSSFASVLLGSFAAVIEASVSGSVLKTGIFSCFMLYAHFIAGIIEGIFTAIIFKLSTKNLKAFSYSILGVSAVLAGIISKYVSMKPDGLEWSLAKLSDNFISQSYGQINSILSLIQEKTAIFASSAYDFNFIGFIVFLGFTTLFFVLLAGKKEVYGK